jgi:hypothetical protein
VFSFSLGSGEHVPKAASGVAVVGSDSSLGDAEVRGDFGGGVALAVQQDEPFVLPFG